MSMPTCLCMDCIIATCYVSSTHIPLTRLIDDYLYDLSRLYIKNIGGAGKDHLISEWVLIFYLFEFTLSLGPISSYNGHQETTMIIVTMEFVEDRTTCIAEYTGEVSDKSNIDWEVDKFWEDWLECCSQVWQKHHRKPNISEMTHYLVTHGWNTQGVRCVVADVKNRFLDIPRHI